MTELRNDVEDTRMTPFLKYTWLIVVVTLAFSGLAQGADLTLNAADRQLIIHRIDIGDKMVSTSDGSPTKLEPYEKDVYIRFGPVTNSDWTPLRLRYQLQGYDTNWREDVGQMCLDARFFDASNNQISESQFFIAGSSPGWRGNFKDSSLDHRFQTVTAPPGARRLMIVIASTGPPSTIGAYAVTDLKVSKTFTNRPSELLLDFPGENAPGTWVQDGTHPTMAQIVELGKEPPAKTALAIVDNDLRAHAEWHTRIESSPIVNPGDHLTVEWNEMYDFADGYTRGVHYSGLPPGQYIFRVGELDALGNPTGVETSIPITVLQPLWKRPISWVAGVMGFGVLIAVIVYYLARRKMQREIRRYETQRELEHERLRIARDIHDDLGARVTQISLASAMAQANPLYPESARADFAQVSQLSRDLVAALYETVWTVTPSNDNLKELGNYLFQISNKLFARIECHCRFYVEDLPREITVSSHVRHNLCLAVKEALNNIIKHARATEASIRIVYQHQQLTILIQDNGRGFQVDQATQGSGLNNLKRRLQDVGGNCTIRSQPGQGTVVELTLQLPIAKK